MAWQARDSHVPAIATPGNTQAVQCTRILASVHSIHLHSALQPTGAFTMCP